MQGIKLKDFQINTVNNIKDNNYVRFIYYSYSLLRKTLILCNV